MATEARAYVDAQMAVQQPARSLVRKLCEVMAAIERIPKRGRNEFHRYDYVTEADLADAVRKELSQRHVFIFPNVKDCIRTAHIVETKNGERKTQLTEVNIEWTFVDGDSGEERTINVAGVGEDNVDKGFYKAFTGSEKYMLMKSFLVPTGDDPEAETKLDMANGKGMQQEIAAAKMAGKQPSTIELTESADQTYFTLSGNGLDPVILSIPEAQHKVMGMLWNGVRWQLPHKSAFAFEDYAKRQGVAIKFASSQAQPQRSEEAAGVPSRTTNPPAASPTDASQDHLLHKIESTKERSGTAKGSGKEWAMLEVHYGGERFICWDKKLWPLLVASVGKLAILETVPSFDKKKDGTIEGIVRIGSAEYEPGTDGVPKAKPPFEYHL